MKLNRCIDHTLLKPDATRAQMRAICTEAKRHGFMGVCVNSAHTAFVVQELKGTGIKTCCVVGFPLGAMASAAKAYEASLCCELGAAEIDMVMDVGAAKDNDFLRVEADIIAVLQAISGRALLKVTIETGLLTDEEKVLACLAAKRAGAQFIKTSTGFALSGATVSDVRLIRETVGPDMGIKASGGIRSKTAAQALIDAGANRIGASASVKIVEE